MNYFNKIIVLFLSKNKRKTITYFVSITVSKIILKYMICSFNKQTLSLTCIENIVIKYNFQNNEYIINGVNLYSTTIIFKRENSSFGGMECCEGRSKGKF